MRAFTKRQEFGFASIASFNRFQVDQRGDFTIVQGNLSQ